MQILFASARIVGTFSKIIYKNLRSCKGFSFMTFIMDVFVVLRSLPVYFWKDKQKRIGKEIFINLFRGLARLQEEDQELDGEAEVIIIVLEK